MSLSFLNSVPSAAHVFVFRGRELLVDDSGAPCVPENLSASSLRLAFKDGADDAAGIVVDRDYECPDEMRFINLRELFALGDEEEIGLASRMKGLAEWLLATKCCCGCGAALVPHPTERALVCPSCGRVHYPRISPCVICVVRREGRMLLLRHRQRNQDIFACLAGFVETGESLEAALRREVREETGLEIRNIRYAGSQSWPFPDQLMVGFYADYESGELKLQEEEIIEAGWFSPDAVPASPRPGSISYKLISGFRKV